MNDKLDQIHLDILKVKTGHLTQKEFDTRYSYIKKEVLKKARLHVEVQEALGDIIMLLASDELKEKTVKKLTEFTDLLIKTYYDGDKINFADWNNHKIVTIKEGKLSYIKDKDKLVRVIFYRKRTINKEVS